ncbi:M1 family metallopeptidase [Chitinophaga sp. Cy-1792]|uniref:M1 family metallopeptidase n=1 Tax=Chitinophaga sp. Cy-1792 TaxID=2608339 RepID=UPI00141DF008|nr:M1 family metallopeptidase [Chitinophaga sp. Cy-1792]NIG53908.1 M1 family metallopeptidase [Chitinophaga sp. Cy-1792]
MRRLIALLYLLSPLTLFAWQQPDYQLHVNADPQHKSFTIKGTLTFEITPDFADSVSITISKSKGPADVQLKGAAASMDTSLNSSGDIVYHWRFRHPLKPGTKLTFSYAYDRGDAPAFQYYMDSSFIMAGGYGAAWYPQLMLRAADGTEDCSRATATIRVTVPVGMMPVMAASKVSNNKETYEFRYTRPDIFSLYIGRYTRSEYQDKIPFYVYSMSNTGNHDDICRKSAAVLDYLTTLFGGLDIPNFSVIEFPDVVSEKTGIGGASILGGVVMPASALRTFNYGLFGHEIGHQWWGNKVLAKGSTGNDMMSEAMAQYGSLQAVMHFDSAHAMHYRTTGYPGYLPDQSGIGYLKNVAAGNDEPLRQLTNGNGHILGDSKGFLAWELLSNITGKATFHKALQTIGDKYSKTGISWNEFLQEIAVAYGSDLQWFYQQWFDRGGAPKWESTWQQQDKILRLHITQQDSLYQLPLEVLITCSDGSTTLQHIQLQHSRDEFQLPVRGTVTSVKVDPFFKVLHWDETLTPMAVAQAKVIRVINLRIQQKPEEAAALAKSFLAEGIPDDQYGVVFSLNFHLGRISTAAGKPAEALTYYLNALQCASRPAELLAYTYYRIAQLAASTNNSEQLEWACRNALIADEANNKYDNIEEKIKQLRK